MGIGAGKSLLDGVDAEEGSVWIGFGILEEVDVDELLDVWTGRGDIFKDG